MLVLPGKRNLRVLTVHHLIRRVGAIWHFVELLLLGIIHLRWLNTVGVGDGSSRACLIASSKLASKPIIFVILLRGIYAIGCLARLLVLVVVLCRQIGLLRILYLVRYALCLLHLLENSVASHPS